MKIVGTARYTHIQYSEFLGIPAIIRREFERLLTENTRWTHYDLLKFDPGGGTISAIQCVDFLGQEEPEIAETFTYNYKTGKTYLRDGGNRIYHHRWMYVEDDFTGFDVERSKIRTEWINRHIVPLPQYSSHKIGNRQYWLYLLGLVEISFQRYIVSLKPLDYYF